MLFLLYLNYLLDDVICNNAAIVDDTTLYSNCDQVFDLWQQLELVTEFESTLQDTGLEQEVAWLWLGFLFNLTIWISVVLLM